MRTDDDNLYLGQFGSYLSNFLQRWKGTIEEGDVFLTNGAIFCTLSIALGADHARCLRSLLHRWRYISSQRHAYHSSCLLQGKKSRVDGQSRPFHRVYQVLFCAVAKVVLMLVCIILASEVKYQGRSLSIHVPSLRTAFRSLSANCTNAGSLMRLYKRHVRHCVVSLVHT